MTGSSHYPFPTYGMAVDRISYKIRSMDGKRLVADDEISSFLIRIILFRRT